MTFMIAATNLFAAMLKVPARAEMAPFSPP